MRRDAKRNRPEPYKKGDGAQSPAGVDGRAVLDAPEEGAGALEGELPPVGAVGANLADVGLNATEAEETRAANGASADAGEGSGPQGAGSGGVAGAETKGDGATENAGAGGGETQADTAGQSGQAAYNARVRARRVRKKNRRKAERTLVQAVLLVIFATLVFNGIFNKTVYTPTTDKPLQSDGFIAISYFGVEKYDSGSRTLIAQKRLSEHVDALHAMGYTTISQQEMLDYYYNGTPLPEKSLFLMFEDGRRDTAVYSQDILKDNNYIATALTYAGKFAERDSKFLSGSDIGVLMDTSYWEMGTNGYRLAYINVYDRYKNFFGELTSVEFVNLNQYMGRDYNHYLMDFIRDEDRLPTETLQEMQRRVEADYQGMKEVYNDEIGFVPQLYVLMHANTGAFGNDDYVSAENQKQMGRLFTMNFNREGFSYNTPESSRYDLTRMQPQANWYPNHLVMRIADDTGHEPVFVVGDEDEAAKWDLQLGAAEFRRDTIVLTSEGKGYGRMALPETEQQDVQISVDLEGNVAGNQGVGLRASEDLQSCVYVAIENNHLFVREITDGTAVDLYQLDLFEFDGGAAQSLEENEQESLMAFGEVIDSYDESDTRRAEAREVAAEAAAQEVATLADGAEGYVPDIDLLDRATRSLVITLTGESLTLEVDGRVAIRNLKVGRQQSGLVFLESSALIQQIYSQRNLADDVYDAVFHDLSIRQPAGEGEKGEVYYEYKLNAWQAFWNRAYLLFQRIATFFIETF